MAGEARSGGEVIEEVAAVDVIDIDSKKNWRETLLRTEKGKVRAILANATVIVEHHEDLHDCLGFDERSQAPMWRSPPPWDRSTAAPRKVIDVDAVELIEWTAHQGGVSFTEGIAFSALITVARRHSFDLVMDYLASLTWDGAVRIDDWLSMYLDAPRDPYTFAVGAAWLISAVARARKPGCKADHMLVLDGPQGTLKSTAIETLAGAEYHSEIAIDVTSKDSALALHGPWIVEWSELAGLGRRETEQVKSFLSRAIDRFRPPYGRLVVDLPRRCVVAGTTNDRSYLSDPTGNRRYWPVTVGAVDLAALELDRDQLWAEAVQRYDAGCPWWLDVENELLAAEVQEEHLLADTWEELFNDALERGSLSYRDWVSTVDLLAVVGIDAGQHHVGHTRHVARVMERLGWSVIRRREGGNPIRGYGRPS